MEVLFYPEDAPFNKLSDIMKASKRTYQLFDIAEIILEKPERFVVLAKNLPDAEGNAKPLYCAQPLNLPFEDEAAAKTAGGVDAKFDELFVSEEIDAEPPKGEFQVVNRCSITGDLARRAELAQIRRGRSANTTAANSRKCRLKSSPRR